MDLQDLVKYQQSTYKSKYSINSQSNTGNSQVTASGMTGLNSINTTKLDPEDHIVTFTSEKSTTLMFASWLNS